MSRATHRKNGVAAALAQAVDVDEDAVTFRASVGDDGVRRVTARLVERVACSVTSWRGEEGRPETERTTASLLPST